MSTQQLTAAQKRDKAKRKAMWITALKRLPILAPLAFVVALALYASFKHGVAVCEWANQEDLVAKAIPLAVDCGMISSSFLILTAGIKSAGRIMAWVTMWFCMLATLGFNIGSAFLVTTRTGAELRWEVAVAVTPAVVMIVLTKSITLAYSKSSAKVSIVNVLVKIISLFKTTKSNKAAPRPRTRKITVEPTPQAG